MNHFVHCCSFSTVIKLLQKGVRVHHRSVILMQKCKIFLGRRHSLPTPHPTRRLWRLDLNPYHSEILPTLLVHLDVCSVSQRGIICYADFTYVKHAAVVYLCVHEKHS